MIRLLALITSLFFLASCNTHDHDHTWLEEIADGYLEEEGVFFVEVWELTEDERLYEKIYVSGDLRYDLKDSFPNTDFVRDYSKKLLKGQRRVHVIQTSPWFLEYWMVEQKDFTIHFNGVGDNVKYRINYFKREEI